MSKRSEMQSQALGVYRAIGWILSGELNKEQAMAYRKELAKEYEIVSLTNPFDDPCATDATDFAHIEIKDRRKKVKQ